MGSESEGIVSLNVGKINSLIAKNFAKNKNSFSRNNNVSFGKNLLQAQTTSYYSPFGIKTQDTFSKSNIQNTNVLLDKINNSQNRKPITPCSYQAFGNGVKLKKPKYIVDGNYRYMLIEPEIVDKKQPLPLIVYLSGTGEYKSGELGTVGFVDKNKDGSISDDEVKHNALGTILSNWNLEDFNAYVIAPSLESNDEKAWASETSEKYVRGIVSSFTKTHNINPEMIFIGGHSIGGMGSLYMATHASDIFSKTFTLSGYPHSSYNIKDISMPIIGYNGQGDSVFMDEDFANTFGSSNFVKVATKHGSVPVNAFNRDANSNGKSDLIEWLLESQKLPENSNEF